MKKIALMFFISLILFSCKKETDKKYPVNPDWLNARISQMETTDYYIGTVVYAFEWNKEYYYLISISLSSCGMCEFYSYKGAKVEWTEEKVDDFQKNGNRLKVVWQREIIK